MAVQILYTGGAGTSSNDENDLTPDYIRYGTSGHNCGAKCLIKAPAIITSIASAKE